MKKHTNKKNRIVEIVLGLLILLVLGIFTGQSDILSKLASQENPAQVTETPKATPTEAPEVAPTATPEAPPQVATYSFRSKKLLNEHFEKHGVDMGFADAASYEQAASAVVTNPDALHKIEKEDGDDVYYVEATNEFVIVSGDGYIRTYFCPDSGIKYYNKQ